MRNLPVSACVLFLCGFLSTELLVGTPSLCVASEVFALEEGQSCLECHDEMEKQQVLHPATEGGDGCISCHEQDDPLQHGFADRPEPIAELCLMCHEDPLAAAHQHPPVVEGDCLFCHNPHQSEHAALLTAPQGELCLNCHDADAFSGQSVHGPVTTNACSACHNPHAAKQAKLLRAAPPELCFRCPDKELEDGQQQKLPATKRLFEDEQAQLHPPFAAGDCGDCHRPHAAEQPRLLSAAYPFGFYQPYREEAYALCLNCHDPAAFSEPRTLDATAFRNGNLNLHQRHVDKTKGRSCGICHSPHGAYQEHLLQSGMTFGEVTLGISYTTTENGGNCSTSCHTKVSYDRLAPVNNPLRVSPRQGEDATAEQLLEAK